MEEWRQIHDFPDYEVSNQGRVKSHKGKSERILKNHPFPNGYLFVILTENGKRKNCLVHRLVLENFCPVDNMKNLEVNHIDANKENNVLENLEWMTRSENLQHRDKMKHTPKAETVLVQFLDEREDMIFPSLTACAKYFNVTRKAINKYLLTQNIRSDRKVQAHFYLIGNTYKLNR